HARRARRGRGRSRAPRTTPRDREETRVTRAAKRTFHSLRYRNYRLFFGGQIVSQTGSWMQRVALGWFILQLTHSPFDVGAIALNSTLFNASRIFGPAVAGALLVAGVGACFLVNAISYLAVLLGLLAMRVSEFFPLEEFERPKILAGTREGLAWIRGQRRMVVLLTLVFVISTFCFNFNVTLPVLAKVTLNAHGYVYGLLFASFGAGALL